MATTKRKQDARIEIRCMSSEKEKLQTAADADRRPLSAWVLMVAVREAEKLLTG